MNQENLYRFSFIVWPPPPDVMNKICQQGFNDTLDFLQRKYLLNCTRCLAVHSKFQLEERNPSVAYHDEVNCVDCSNQKKVHAFHRIISVLI